MRSIFLSLILLGLFGVSSIAQEPLAAASGNVLVVNDAADAIYVTVGDQPQARPLEPGGGSVLVAISVGTKPATVKLLVYKIKPTGKAELKASTNLTVQSGKTTTATITSAPKPNGDLTYTITAAIGS